MIKTGVPRMLSDLFIIQLLPFSSHPLQIAKVCIYFISVTNRSVECAIKNVLKTDFIRGKICIKIFNLKY